MMHVIATFKTLFACKLALTNNDIRLAIKYALLRRTREMASCQNDIDSLPLLVLMRGAVIISGALLSGRVVVHDAAAFSHLSCSFLPSFFPM